MRINVTGIKDNALNIVSIVIGMIMRFTGKRYDKSHRDNVTWVNKATANSVANGQPFYWIPYRMIVK